MNSLLIAAIAGLCLFALGWMQSAARAKQLNRQLQETETRLDWLANTVDMLCSSAVGVDKRISQLERHGRALESRQETFETAHQSDRPYSQAINMVQKGATAERLVDELQLSRSEAELLVMLHGVKEAV